VSSACAMSEFSLQRQPTAIEGQLMRKICEALVLLGLFGCSAYAAQAQAMAESGISYSNSKTTAESAKPSPATMAAPATPSSSPHLPVKTGLPPAEVNRKEFESNAGEDAGSVLLRSLPAGAEIFVNDLIVGRTPLLLVIGPGKYKIEMRGPRQETGSIALGVMPKEKQTVVIHLKQRYPSTVSVH
jgi:hypothetical protein